jgi:hypothetical protein
MQESQWASTLVGERQPGVVVGRHETRLDDRERQVAVAGAADTLLDLLGHVCRVTALELTASG